jgi:hypothetical protein
MSGETDAFYINICQVCAITNNCPTVTKDMFIEELIVKSFYCQVNTEL